MGGAAERHARGDCRRVADAQVLHGKPRRRRLLLPALPRDGAALPARAARPHCPWHDALSIAQVRPQPGGRRGAGGPRGGGRAATTNQLAALRARLVAPQEHGHSRHRSLHQPSESRGGGGRRAATAARAGEAGAPAHRGFRLGAGGARGPRRRRVGRLVALASLAGGHCGERGQEGQICQPLPRLRAPGGRRAHVTLAASAHRGRRPNGRAGRGRGHAARRRERRRPRGSRGCPPSRSGGVRARFERPGGSMWWLRGFGRGSVDSAITSGWEGERQAYYRPLAVQAGVL
mmetsp:Transcript_18871/g.62258  ORF Transcript_18871/g.62258 Transcript_18871/m.62258 type:complete len:290 (+) Transcript_18871:613-1482(+)